MVETWYIVHMDIASTVLTFDRKKLRSKEGRRKVLATLTQVHNEEHRHRFKIQTHTQNKEQMHRTSSQVTFAKKIYKKYYFI